MPEAYWQDMSTERIATSDPSSWIVVFPCSAIEQHGPHLPLSTDRIIGEKMVETALNILPPDLPVSFLPVQAVGQSVEHASYPGTLSSDWSKLLPFWLDILQSVAQVGVRKVILITSHGGNSALLNILALELRRRSQMLAVATSWMRFGQPVGLIDPEEWRMGIHGGDAETSLMLHFRSDLVDMKKARDFRSTQLEFEQEFTHLRAHGPHAFGWMAEDLNPSGAIGNASLAMAEKGKALADFQARRFVELCWDVHKMDLNRLA